MFFFVGGVSGKPQGNHSLVRHPPSWWFGFFCGFEGEATACPPRQQSEPRIGGKLSWENLNKHHKMGLSFSFWGGTPQRKRPGAPFGATNAQTLQARGDPSAPAGQRAQASASLAQGRHGKSRAKDEEVWGVPSISILSRDPSFFLRIPGIYLS